MARVTAPAGVFWAGKLALSFQQSIALSRADNERTKELSRLVSRFQAENGKPVLHDPLAMAEALHGGMVTLTPLSRSVEEDGRLPQTEGEPNVKTATAVALTTFMPWFQEGICR